VTGIQPLLDRSDVLFWKRSRKPFLDGDDESWQLEVWQWLLRHCGGAERLHNTKLVTPTRDFFPPTEASGHERALHVFDAVRRHAGMSDWTCDLVAQMPSPELRVGDVTALKIENGPPAGTFSTDGNRVVISYAPNSLGDPLALVATLIHELSHYLLASLPEPPPGGGELAEFATDLTTVYLGFGLFGANTAFRFRQHQDATSQGWSLQRLGYLTERHWVFALAIFFSLRGQAIEIAKPFTRDHLFADLRKASAYLEANASLLDGLRSI
jgi:hypothetical protein